MNRFRTSKSLRTRKWLVLISSTFTALAAAEDIYVSPQDTAALMQAKAGDTVWLKGGRYSEPIGLQGLRGTADEPITLAAVPGETVVLDGTDELPNDWKRVTHTSPEGKLIQPAQWKRMQGKVYCLKLDKPVYALIHNDRLMSDARWPNARWDDPWRLDRYMVLRKASEGSKPGLLIDGLPTENTLEESSKWIHYDRSRLMHREESLADTEIDFSGGSVLMSCFWTSFGTHISKHQAGDNQFKFDAEFNGSGSLQQEAIRYLIERVEWDNPAKFKKSSHGGIHFFLMGLPALDIPEEWAYHAESKTLFFVSPDGQTPAGVRGKRRDYGITIKDSSYIQLKGIDFFGTAALLDDCSHSRIEDCNFRFSAYNKFAAGNYDMPPTTEIRNKRGNGEQLFGNGLVNCRFEYLDGNAFKGRSPGLSVDNVYIYRTQMTTLSNDSRSASFDAPLLVRRITLSDIGASVGIAAGGIDAVYELNNLMRFGGLQYDGASLQMGGTEEKIYRFNWSHDHPKFSYRFDTAKYGTESTHGDMSFNMAWNTPGGYMVKGNKHLVQHNTLVGEGGVLMLNAPEWASVNKDSLAANNAVDGIFADRRAGKADQLGTLRNNVLGDIGPYLRDPANLDFRPKAGSPLIDAGQTVQAEEIPWKKTEITQRTEIVGTAPDAGAYEAGASSYWIPGFKFPHASTPIPPDGTNTAKPDCSLMWLGGYKAEKHHLYTGSSEQEVNDASQESHMYRGVFEGDENIYSFSEELKPGTAIYWRVDSDRDGRVIKGPVWKFTVEI